MRRRLSAGLPMARAGLPGNGPYWGGEGSRGLTAASIIHQHLRDEIVSLVRAPGAVISEKDIATAHGVSRTPVREALLRLADEGLVEIAPKSGTFVSRIPVAALPEAIVARMALEEVTARTAAQNASGSAVSGLRAILERQAEMAGAEDHAGFHDADEAFHQAVAEAARYPGLWRMVQQLKTQVDRFRHLTLPQPGRMERVIVEHGAVVDAIAAHDPEAAAAAMRAHVEGLRASLGEMRDVNPGYFDGDLAGGLSLQGVPERGRP
ncbi:GntR family transcriptional regulator [Azorhizobium oxalatiphilum]|uniref:GntR family transcriptional regulator n=1 Tax=Azorhizobium oxalatiphilum TaxID=980631 RepID=A0A917BZL8_9HYPH|nr:GntR family transcriptional regulator [Azorhizobium oxalatiphilum]GGF62946.1 GntR family transcriptional regulator [Azorhizobium oxalatiphilum]